jgi:hypothetical protein
VASGLFFIGYLVLEVSSNLILQRVGARRWIARIMVSWGDHRLADQPRPLHISPVVDGCHRAIINLLISDRMRHLGALVTLTRKINL